MKRVRLQWVFLTSTVILLLVAVPSLASTKPQNVRATDGEYPGKIVIEWSSVSDANRYDVYRNEPPSRSWTKIGYVTAPTRKYTDNDVDSCQTYNYYVQAIVSDGYGTPSDPDDGYASGSAPAIPTSLDTHIEIAHEKIPLTWDAMSGAKSYVVYRSEGADGPFTEIATTTANSYVDVNVTPCVNYQYRIQTCAGPCGCSEQCAPEWGIAFPDAPAEPVMKTPKYITAQCSATLEWEPVPDATGYEVLSPALPNGALAVSGTSCTVPPPSAADCAIQGTWNYRVRARNYCTQSPTAHSWVDITWQSEGDLAVPLDVSATQTVSQGVGPAIALTWSPVVGASRYEVFASDGTAAPPGVRIGVVYPTADSGATSSHTASSGSGNEQATLRFVEGNQALGVATYSIRACCGCTCSAFAALEAQKPVPPMVQNVWAEQGTRPNVVAVGWDPIATTGFTYEVDRIIPGGVPEVYWSGGVVIGGTIGFPDWNVTPCVVYSYVVRACNASGCGEGTPPVTGWAGPLSTAPFLSRSGWGTAEDPVVLKWSPVASAQSYELRRREKGAEAETVLVTMGQPSDLGTPLTYIDTNVSLCAEYEYRVASCNSCGCQLSNVSPLERGLQWPCSNLGACLMITSVSGTEVHASWTTVPRATEYDVVVQALGSGATHVYEHVIGTELAILSSDLVELPHNTPMVMISVRARNACGRVTAAMPYGTAQIEGGGG